jgi:transcriptional regulator with XRE-family HTH domain
LSSIGERLRHIRKKRNLTLQKVHELTGISISTLSNWENDNVHPNTSALKRWASGIGIEFEDIHKRPEIHSTYNPTEEELLILSLIRQLSPPEQMHLMSLLQLMVNKKTHND